MRQRTFVRIVASVLATPFFVIAYLNIENYAESKGWGGILTSIMEGQMPSVLAFLLQPWLGVAALALVGLAAGVWVDGIAKRMDALSAESPPATSEQRAILKALDALFAEGTKHMNRLIPPIEGYDDEAEREVLHQWQDRVLEKMDQLGVSVPIMSRFTTFWKFNATFHRIEGKNAQQELLEGIWDEKLRQLRVIIDSFDNPRRA
jgi:hypothetical protein